LAATIPEVLKQFEIRFTDVPPIDQLAIREALQEMNPPQKCVEDFEFEVKVGPPGHYQVGCRGKETARRCLPFGIEETDAAGIARRLKQLISDCWQ
jgi:hypothetical protein